MTVLDAYALVAYLRDERAADEVAALLRSPTTLTTVNAAEVVDQLVRVFGHDADGVHGDLLVLSHAGMQLVEVPPHVGISAGRLRARYYHRERMALSLADCVAAATSLSDGRPLATADPPLANLLRAEGGTVHALPDTKGRVP